MGKLIILSGPSCAGKSPLEKALKRLRPDVHGRLHALVLYNSRDPRPGERGRFLLSGYSSNTPMARNFA